MKTVLVALTTLLVVVGRSLAGGIDPNEVPQLKGDIGAALAPLKSLNPEQMSAVAALVVASRAGLDVSEYCPPLGKFPFREFSFERHACFGEEVGLARAWKECKGKKEKDCPDLIEADGQLAQCQRNQIQQLKRSLDLLGFRGGRWPRPQPKPE